MAAGVDRLSGLHDDLLRRILHFAPAREGASTSALSTRWTRSPLWIGSGAVNLEISLHDIYDSSIGSWERRRRMRDAMASRAHEALDAADKTGVPVTRLTFSVEARSHYTIDQFFSRGQERRHDVIDGVVAHRAARRVEELRIAAVASGTPQFERMNYGEYSHTDSLRAYRLRLGSLPSETLRVLELTNCSGLDLPPSSAIAFPRLASLRLRHCEVQLEVLQAVIDAAPMLTVIHLESVLLEEIKKAPRRPAPEEGLLCRLSCPAAAVLVLDRCGWMKEACMEIDAPRLRRFRYSGVLRQISLTPRSPGLVQADLTLLDYTCKDPRDVHRNFWRFVSSYTHVKKMKLKVRDLEEIAIASEARRVQFLPEFRNLERLELEGVHRPTGKTAAVAIANLLRCCPALRDLRMKLSKTGTPWYGPDFLEKKHSSDLQDSINRFKRHRSEPMAAGEEDDDGKYDDIPGKSILHRCGRLGLICAIQNL